MDVKIETSWKKALADEFEKPYFKELAEFVRGEYVKYRVFPPPKYVFHALELCPYDKVRVVILGQDPYHGVGQAHGLCFSVPEETPVPPSLQNIYKEIRDDLGISVPKTGNLERWAAQSSDAIICVSDHERQLGLSYRIAPPEKLTLIPNGADLSAVHGDRTTARTLLGLPSDALVFGSVTRFAHQKDPLGLIAALIPIAARFPHFHLVMVGEGPLLAAAGELVARHRAEGQIHLTGFRTDATALLFGFDAFLLSSRYEGLAYGVLEAMAAGLPIITTAGGNEQAVQQGVNGLVVPVDDQTALQTAVTTLLQDHHRRRSFGQQSRVRVQQFTVGGMVEKTEALYRRLVEKKGLLLE